MFAAIAAKFRENGGELRLGRRGTFAGRFAVSRPQLSMELCLFEEGYSLQLFGVWIYLCRASREPHEMMESWGFTFFERTIHLNWGDACKIVHLPWDLDWFKTEHMLVDGSFVVESGRTRFRKRISNIYSGDRYRQEFPYHYTLESGEVQERIATVMVDRRSWCWRGFPFWFLRWPLKVRTSIDIRFNDEVGERTGSWKGGVQGTGYDLLPNETPEQCLRRFERNEKL